jgi:hypothetical protein
MRYQVKDSGFFYLKGSFDGDGCYRKDRPRIDINVTDFDFLEEIKKQIKNVFGFNVQIKNHAMAHDNCKEQRKISYNYGEKIYDALKNTQPSTREEKIEYLKGLWDAEGSVGLYDKKIIRKGKEYIGHEKKLVISQKDNNKLSLWYDYMKSLGINSIKLYREDTRSELSIRDNASWKKFHELIGFRIKRKQDKLNDIVSRLMSSKMSEDMQLKIIAIYDNTNFGAGQIGRMFGKSKFAVLQMLKSKNIKTNKANIRKLNYNDIDFAETILNKELPFKINNRDLIKFEIPTDNCKAIEIESIEFSHEECGVDLHTPEYHNFFLANGILSHNSTLAIQMCTFVDWCIQGGKMVWNEDGQVVGLIPPKKKLRFNLDHVVFNPEDLIKMTKLKGKHEKNNVFLLDEGREGLLGARAMESVNKQMDDYFQTCGVYNNFIVIVLPDFFKLAEQYCVNRSLFLLNVFHRNFERGYFSFFNTLQKERLYFFGKKRLGITARYNAASRNFWGRFSKWLPFDLKLYEDKKKFFIGKTKHTKLEVAHMRQRDLLTYIVRNRLGWTYEQIGKELERFGEDTYGIDAVMRSIRNAERIINDAKYYADGEEEPTEDLKKETILKQDAEFHGLDEGALEKIREPEITSYGVEYNNDDVKEKSWAPITKVGKRNTFVVQNSADGVNPETIDEERLAMDAIKEKKSEDLSSVAFSSDEADPIFDQSKIDYYKIKEVPHKNKFVPTIYDNTSESGYASDVDDETIAEVEDSDEDGPENLKISEISDEDSEKIEKDKKLLQDSKLDEEEEENSYQGSFYQQ